MGAIGAVPHCLFMLLMLMLLCPVPVVVMRAVNTLPLLSFPVSSPWLLSHLAPGRPVQLMSFDFVARLVVVVDGIKAYVNVNTDVVAS